ncbi:hypothetical protein ANMWB30_24420 [Arthrobacter sp. MWB30]|nr:hypothetical protein ANMWB30_24420 [Arthrobacter sp. MWB30]
MTETLPEDSAEPTPKVVRTAAFIVDGRATSFLLAETVISLINLQHIQHALVDLSTAPGVAIARSLADASIDFSILDHLHRPDEPDNDETVELRNRAQGTVPFDLGNIGSLNANYVLVPAGAANNGQGIDATPGTIIGLALAQFQQEQQRCLLLLPPEEGLVRLPDNTYVRRTLVLVDDTDTATSNHPTSTGDIHEP